jgi:hypothetical protein
MSFFKPKINKIRTILLLKVQNELEIKSKKNEEMKINRVPLKDLNEKYNINKIKITIKEEQIMNFNFISPNLNISFLDNLHLKNKLNSDENLINLSMEMEERKTIQEHLSKKKLHKGKTIKKETPLNFAINTKKDKIQIKAIRYLKSYAKNFININLKKNTSLTAPKLNKLHNYNDLMEHSQKKQNKQKKKNDNEIKFEENTNTNTRKSQVKIKHSHSFKKKKNNPNDIIINNKNFSKNKIKTSRNKKQFNSTKSNFKLTKENEILLDFYDGEIPKFEEYSNKFNKKEKNNIYLFEFEKPLIQLHKCPMIKN